MKDRLCDVFNHFLAIGLSEEQKSQLLNKYSDSCGSVHSNNFKFNTSELLLDILVKLISLKFK